MKKMYKKAGCNKCKWSDGYILHPGEQYTPYHSGSGFYERCDCSKIYKNKYQAILDDKSLTRAQFEELVAEFYDNNKIEKYENN